jgi:hypothetical protein
MIFRRTPDGESNTHLFLRVDAVVYVEGGHSLTPDEISAGRYDVYSVDIQFWQRTFGAFFPGRSLDFRAVGAKPTLVSIAEDVIAGRIKNVVVAMDRDHDEFKGRLKSGPNVLYTQGYSWECDVWPPEVTEEVFFALCPVSRAAVGVRAIVDGLFAELKRKLHWLVYATLFSRSMKALCCREISQTRCSNSMRRADRHYGLRNCGICLGSTGKVALGLFERGRRSRLTRCGIVLDIS